MYNKTFKNTVPIFVTTGTKMIPQDVTLTAESALTKLHGLTLNKQNAVSQGGPLASFQTSPIMIEDIIKDPTQFGEEGINIYNETRFYNPFDKK